MDAAEKQALYEKAKAKWGSGSQIIQAIEELTECAAALARWTNGKAKLCDVYTELADAEIMLEQMRFNFGPEGIESEKEAKLNRLKGRINANGG